MTTLSPFNKEGRAKNRNITVSYLVFPPYILSAGTKPVGIDVDIMDTISSRLDISIDYRQANTFNTLVNALTEGHADMCISQPGLSTGRVNAGLDYFFMIIRDIKYAQRHPVPLDSFYTVSQPFSKVVWVWTLVTIISIAITFMSFNRYVYRYIKRFEI